MDKKEQLLKQIYEKEKEFDKNKSKRFFYYILGLSVFFFLLFLNKIEKLKDLFIAIPSSIFIAFWYFYINLLLFLPLFQKGTEESKIIENLHKEYALLNKESSETCNIDKYL